MAVWAYAPEAEAQFQKDLFEAAVVGGYRWGGNSDIEKGGQDGRITAEGDPAFGASIGVRTEPDGVIYVWYSRQSTTLTLRPRGASGPFPTRDVTFEYLLFGHALPPLARKRLGDNFVCSNYGNGRYETGLRSRRASPLRVEGVRRLSFWAGMACDAAR